MTEDKILDFRERVQPRLRDYLKAHPLPDGK